MKRLRKFIKFLLVFLISIIGFLFLLFIAINLPFSHRFVTKQTNLILSNSDIPIHIRSIGTILPTKVDLQGVGIIDADNDTVIYAGQVEADYLLPAIIVKKVLLRRVYLNSATVKLSRSTSTSGFNIAEIFSPDSKPKKVEAKNRKNSWEISIRKGALSNINFQMIDTRSGIEIFQEIAALKMKSFKLSLLDKSVFLSSVEMSGADGEVKITPHPLGEKSKNGSPWNFGLRKVSLNDLNFTFDHGGDSLLLNLILGEGLIRANQMDLNKKEIDIAEISIREANTTILTGNPSRDPKSSRKHSSAPFPWNFQTEKLDLGDVTIMLGNYGAPIPYAPVPEISITDLDLSLSDIQLSNMAAAVEVKKLSFDTDNGFSMKRTRGRLDSHSETTRLNLEIETGNSQLHLEGDAEAPFFDIIAKPSEIQNAKIAIHHTHFSLRDISCFRTNLQENPLFTSLAIAPYNLTGDIGLENSVLSFSEISLSQERNFNITLEGVAENPFQPVKSILDLQLGIPDINHAWLSEMLADVGIEQHLPEFSKFSAESNISDSFMSPDFTLKLKSDLGNVDLLGSFDIDSDSFSVHAEFNRLMLGTILNSESVGSFSGSGEFAGSGFDQDSMVATIAVVVDSLRFQDYDYTAARFDGHLRPGADVLNLLVDDPALKWTLHAIVNPVDSALEVKATSTLFAQLNHLNLYEDTLALDSRMAFNFEKGRGVIETDFEVADLKLISPHDSAQVGHINLLFKTDSVRTKFTGDADFFNANIQIDKPIDELETVMQSYRNYVTSFFNPMHTDAATRVSYLPEMSATTTITYHNFLRLFIQDTTLHFTNLDFSLINRVSDHRIKYKMKGAGLEYKMLKMGELNASLTDSAGIMELQIVADSNSIFTSPANKLLLNTRFANWKSLTGLSVIDQQDEVVYGFEILSRVDSNNVTLTIPSRELILNHKHWYMDTPALLSVNVAAKTISPELKMHTDSSNLHLLTVSDEEFRQYSCKLSNVSFASLLLEDMLPGNPVGTISGSLDYRMNEDQRKAINTDLQFTDVGWSDLSYNNINLYGIFRSTNPGDFTVDLSARLDSSEITIKGGQKDGGNRIIKTGYKDIPINTVEPFVKDYLSELSGNISGNLNISSGEVIETLEGNVKFDNANLRINTLNSKYKIAEENLLFTGQKLMFNKFKILDSLDNELLVDGDIDFSNRKSINADLEISSSQLQVMNRSDKENVSFYGDVFMDSRLSLKGPLANPVIEGKLLLSEGTEVFYKHMEDLTLSESEKIVSFVSQTSSDDQMIAPPVQRQNTFGNSSIETIVEIDPTTKINFNLSKRIYIIDLMIQGGGSLNYHMLNNNQVSLSGRYEISEGNAYVNLIGWPNKSFRIQKGGFIRWDGMVENPELKIEALNRVSSSYTNPVDGQRRDVDFNVILQLSNHLSELDVAFTIHTTDQYLMSIINTLSPEEQMRQAIAILLFETIDLPGISTSTNYMTEQVNQLVASQLNQLTKTTIKGIDISFGIDSYVQSTETGGEETKTSLSYEVRKELLNNRAQIELSGRLNDLNQQPGASDLSLNNISFEYRLDSAGTKFLKVYNEHSYEDVFVGEVIKTGVGITYRKRYRSFRDIWKREEENRKIENQGK
ncbi:MAG: translocation/assembly module TamB domain-containing protein [Bacteroidota bacterium]